MNWVSLALTEQIPLHWGTAGSTIKLYCSIGLPPSLAGWSHERVRVRSDPSQALTLKLSGIEGGPTNDSKF